MSQGSEGRKKENEGKEKWKEKREKGKERKSKVPRVNREEYRRNKTTREKLMIPSTRNSAGKK